MLTMELELSQDQQGSESLEIQYSRMEYLALI